MSERIYLDNAATTKLDPPVGCLISPYKFGNPSSLYREGREAKGLIDNARRLVAEKLFCDPHDIIFTSGGTESDNLAIRGVVFSYIKRHPDSFKPHIISSTIEHKAVLNTLKDLKELNLIDYDLVPVDEYGFVDQEAYIDAFNSRTILASIMMANNEVGTIQDIDSLSRIAHEKGVLFHTDAVQAFCKMEIDLLKLKHVDFLSISGHKINGIKGAGALYVRYYAKPSISPIITGGGQEGGLRSGTENVLAIEALGYASMIVRDKHLSKLRDMVIDDILREIPGTYLNGPKTNRLPDNINIGFSNITGEEVVMRLDAKGIAVSAGSACNSGELSGSHVLLAMGRTKQESLNCVRITIPDWTPAEDLVRLVLEIKSIVNNRDM